MQPRSRSDHSVRGDGGSPPAGERPDRGFTLIELLVALTLVVLILTMAGQVVFSMKRGADRMKLRSETQQLAQKAADYLAFHLRGASDMNREAGNPAAVMVWLQRNSNPLQVSYNNVTDGSLADLGTDIITVARPETTFQARCLEWHGWGHAANSRWEFGIGCPDGQANMELFKSLTGYDDSTNPARSAPIILVDALGQYGIYQITNYLENQNVGAACSATPPEIHVTGNPGLSEMVNPPGGQPDLVRPINMQLGVQFHTFRVHNGWLEQKDGIFDPAHPDQGFVPILPQIEDLQLAWIYNDGTIWNTRAQELTTTAHVPDQGTTNARDVINVRGFRLSVCARSATEITWDPNATFRRPAIEDHGVGNDDRFFHEETVMLAMIRNRNLQR